MGVFEIAGLVELVALATLVLILIRRDRLKRADSDLVELSQVAFDSSPIAMLIRQNGVYVHCNDASVRILGVKDKSQVLEVGPARIVAERQRDGRPAADIFRECAEVLKQGKMFHYQGLEGKTLDSGRAVYIDAYWVPAKYRGGDAVLSYIVEASDRMHIAEEAREQTQQIARDFETTIGGLV